MATKNNNKTTENKSFSERFSKNINGGEISAEVKKKVADEIIRAKLYIITHYPFFGILSMRLRSVPADRWLPTMATDGKYLYYNHAFVEGCTPEELRGVMVHEILHCVYDHVGDFARNQKRGINHQLMNIAMDFVINGDIFQHNGEVNSKQGKTGKTYGTLPDFVCHDKKYYNWASEDVYNDLRKKTNQMTPEEAKEFIEDLMDRGIDVHVTGLEGEDDEENTQGRESPNGPARMGDTEREKLSGEIKDAIVNAAKQDSNPGNLPLGVQRLVEALLETKLDWRALLPTELSSLLPYDQNFFRASRRNDNSEFIFPGDDFGEHVSVAVAIDTSGSISEGQLVEFLSEVGGLMTQYQSYSVHVFTFDTKGYNLQHFTQDNGMNILDYRPEGGGGTDGDAIFSFMKSEELMPDKLVVFTDGYVGSWGDPNYCDTVWIIHSSKEVPAFGKYAYYDTSEK